MSQQPPKPETTHSEFYARALELTALELAQIIRQNLALRDLVIPTVPVHENGQDLLRRPNQTEMAMICLELGHRVEESALFAVRSDLSDIKNMLQSMWKNSALGVQFPPSSEK